jgi:hypothetical protein
MMAQKVYEAVQQYLDQTARAHTCAGWDCAVCSLHSARGEEMYESIKEALGENQ